MSLSPLYLPRSRVQPPPVNVNMKVHVPAPPVAPPPVATKPRVDLSHLTVADVRHTSTEALNLLVPHRPDLVAAAIINAGAMRRAESPLSPSVLSPVARAVVISAKKRRAEAIDAEENAFMSSFLEEIGAA